MSDGDISLDKLPEYIDSLKATITQQAQELERLTLANEMLKGCVAEESRRLAAMTTEREVLSNSRDALVETVKELREQLAASQARVKELDYKLDIVGKDFTSNMMYQGQLERTNADLQATLAARCRELEEQVHHSREDF